MPQTCRLGQCVFGIDRRLCIDVRGTVIEHKGLALAGAHAELRNALHILAFDGDGGCQFQRVGSRCEQQYSTGPVDPGHDGTVIESDPELHAQTDPAAQALDNAHDIPALAREGHEVDDANASFLGVEFGFEHEAVAAVPAPYPARSGDGSQQPASVLRPAEKCGETGPRVESRQAEPIDGAVAADQRGRVAIADQGVVLDRQRHRNSQEPV